MPLILQSIMDCCSLYETLNGSTLKIYTLLISLKEKKLALQGISKHQHLGGEK